MQVDLPRTGHITGWYQTQGVAFGCACVCGLHQPHPPSTAAPRHGLAFRNLLRRGLKHMCCKVTVMAALSLQSAVLLGTTAARCRPLPCCARKGSGSQASIGTIHICTYMPYMHIWACMFRFFSVVQHHRSCVTASSDDTRRCVICTK